MLQKSEENENVESKGHCICCEKELELECREHKPDVWYIAHESLIFRAHGNYGSTQYDPIGSWEYLELFLCDECLKKKGHLVTRVKFRDESHLIREETFTDYIKRLRAKYGASDATK